MIKFKTKDDVKSATKALKSVAKEVEEGYDTEVYEKIREEVRKNPCTQVKTAKLPFMHLGADTNTVQPEKKHRQSVMHPTCNQGLIEELAQVRQRLYSE